MYLKSNLQNDRHNNFTITFKIYRIISLVHRCTVVGSPGGGGYLVFFWQILLRGVLGVVRKSVRGSLLLHFYVEVFQNLYRGYMRCPHSPLSSPPVCIYGLVAVAQTILYNKYLRFRKNRDF